MVAPHDWWKEVLSFSTSVGLVLGGGRAATSLAACAAEDGPHTLNLAAWELLEACFVVPLPARPLAGALVTWLQRNSGATCGAGSASAALRQLLASIASSPRPEEVAGFWPTAARLVALGWTRACCELLQMHSVWGEWRLRKPQAQPVVSALEAVEKLLARARHAERRLQQPESEPGAQEWRSDVEALLSQPPERHRLWAPLAETGTGVGLRTLVRILAGEEEAIVGATASWRELFAAQLCHVYPTLSSPRDLMRVAAASLSRKPLPAGAAQQPLDALLLASLDSDAAECVRVCSSHLDSWFNAHAPELLAAGGAAQQAQLAGASQWYRLVYAAECAAAPGLQHVSFTYFAAAGPAGQAALEELARLPCSDERAQLRTLALAERFTPADSAGALCALGGERAEASGAMGSALQWHLRCGQAEGLERVLAHALRRDGPWALPQLARCQALLSCVCAEEAGAVLAPALHYASLQAGVAASAEALRCGAPAAEVRALEGEAAEAVRELLRGAPRSFWPAALLAALPLLEGPSGALDADAHLLAGRLAELVSHPWAALEAEPTEGAAAAAQAALRLSLARAASRLAV